MRIGGIASGMDTEQMVRDLMRAERNRINKFFRQEQTMKWRQEAYNDVNRVMANFILNSRRDLGITQVGVNGTLRQNATNSLNWIKSANSSNEGIVSATARGNAMNGNHTVEVLGLASNATVSSKNIDTMLEDGKFKNAGTIRIETGEGIFADIEIKVGSTIQDFISKINNATSTAEGPDNGKSLGLRAAYDKDLGQFMITTRETGVNKYIKITDKEPDPEKEEVKLARKFFSIENLIRLNGGVEGLEDLDGIAELDNIDELGSIQGKDARIKFNETVMEKPTNNFSVFGIDLNLRSVAEGTKVNINVDTNVDGIFNKIKALVDSYNEMLDTINGKVNEKQHRSFHPLVQDEKDAMSDKDVELWEEKARSGLLRNDEVLNRTLRNLRGDLYKDVNGTEAFNHITAVGITTGNYRDGGKLVIDEDKLRAAISSNPEGVMDLFFKAPDASKTGEDRINDSGLIQRLYDGLVTGMKDVVRRSGTGEDASLLRNVQSNILIDFVTNHSSISVLDRDLMGLNSRIAREEAILNQREDRYWRQFTAMEKALGQMQQQSMWLMSQMGGMM